MQLDMIDISAGTFDANTGNWVRVQPSSQDIDRDSLTFATFNIWFGDYFAQERYNAIANLLEQHRPDFIALQEVTCDALDLFLGQRWIQEEYFSSDVDGITLGDYGVLLLSRLPLQAIKLIPLPSFMGRRLLIAEADVNGAALHVGTVHLESLKSSAKIRRKQLTAIFRILKDVQNVVVMGDFNFDASWDKENRQIDPAYHDVWNLLRGDEPGFTEDTSVNLMRYLMKGKHKHVRFDRVLLKSAAYQDSGWVASSIELLGTKPISPEFPDVFPSDHFGLLCRISKR